MFPPVPPPEGMHPLFVHFPIALLLVVPVFLVLAIVFPKNGWWFSVSALILLTLGTSSACVAMATGVKARDVVEEGPDAMFDALDQHAALVAQARNVFAGLTIVYAVIVFLPLFVKRLATWKYTAATNLVFLALVMGGNGLLAKGAHEGGRVVHEFGVKAALGPEKAADPKPATAPTTPETQAAK